MAENKKSFILYVDLIHTVKKMPPELAGRLFVHILEYVNDLNPETDDLLLQISFEPIKQQLKRDLVKFREIVEKRSKAGQISAESRKKKRKKSTHVESVEHASTNSTDSVNDNGTDSVINKKVLSDKQLEYKKAFDDWLEMRKKIKKPATSRAIELAKKKLKELTKGNMDMGIKILEHSTLNNYQDLYELKSNGQFTKEQPASLPLPK